MNEWIGRNVLWTVSSQKVTAKIVNPLRVMFAGIIQSEPLLLRLPPSAHHWHGDSCVRNPLSLRHRVAPLVLSTGTTGLSTGEYDWLVLSLTPDTW